MQGAPEVKPAPTYLRKAPEIWKMAKNGFNQSAENLFMIIIFFFYMRADTGCNFKTSNSKLDLIKKYIFYA